MEPYMKHLVSPKKLSFFNFPYKTKSFKWKFAHKMIERHEEILEIFKENSNIEIFELRYSSDILVSSRYSERESRIASIKLKMYSN